MADIEPLADQSCVPCRGGVPPLAADARAALLQRLGAEWQVVDGHHLSKTFRFEDFAAALAYTNRVGAMAEEQGHHPDLYLAWGVVRVDV